MGKKLAEVVLLREIQPERYENWVTCNAEIKAGDSVRLFGQHRDGKTMVRVVTTGPSLQRDRRPCDDWLNTLSLEQLLFLTDLHKGSPPEVVQDWIEEHGGVRYWNCWFTTRVRPANNWVTYERTFLHGSQARWGRYNVSYHGPITRITPRTVSIYDECDHKERRLDYAKFALWNWDFDLAAVEKKDSDTMMYL